MNISEKIDDLENKLNELRGWFESLPDAEPPEKETFHDVDGDVLEVYLEDDKDTNSKNVSLEMYNLSYRSFNPQTALKLASKIIDLALIALTANE